MDTETRPTKPSMDQERMSADTQRSLPNRDRKQDSGTRRPSATTRVCGKCGGSLTGQFVRALEDTFHLECFTCHECGKVVASKFFPVPEQPPGQYPLCERDYFKRLDLLCFKCGGALRGSYITALDHKYHIEHFTCSVCPTVFGAADSYYEHEGSVYCHYHYSTRFAQKCNGCQTAILKQFVEIFRNGQNQHWHPECYMIHKYWNVRLHAPGQPLIAERKSIEGDASETDRHQVKQDEEKIEEKVLWIWRTLSQYEEKSAGCISDMLLHVSNGAYVDGVMIANKFIVHVDLLFNAADSLDQLMVEKTSKGLSYSRESKLLCKKVVAFFQLLAESQDTGVRRLGVTQELLSLVTGLAHYLKLLIRICLQGALKLERDLNSDQGLHVLLGHIGTLETKLEKEESAELARKSRDYVNLSADTCPICQRPVEDRCFRLEEKVFHHVCMKCEVCHQELVQDYHAAKWDERSQRVFCTEHGPSTSAGGFVAVSRLQQYVHLLRVAHARLLATLRTSGALPHTSDDPNLEKYDSNSGHRVRQGAEGLTPPLLRSDTRSKSYSGRSSSEDPGASVEETLGNIRRLRSTRMEKQLSTTNRQARTSRIINGPEGTSVRPGSAGADGSEISNSGFRIIRDKDTPGTEPVTMTFGNTDSIRLDDIPRLVAAEQAKDQRPNANKYAHGGLMRPEPKPRLVSNHKRETSGGPDGEKIGLDGGRTKKYFSELTPLEYFVVRHVAVVSMAPLLEGHFNQEELLDLIEMRKPTFWGKFGKAFNKDKSKTSRKKGVFGVPLEVLVDKDGAESTDGIGPGVLKVPALVQDAVSSMRTKDMSMEGVFRKNGNIRRLKEMAEVIDSKGGDAVDLEVESPVQVAALLKKFLREMPDPMLTFKLHKLFCASQKINDGEKRKRVLHLSCCLLPKPHRDTMEVLFCFLNWAASFSVVDEESGSKMDVHNLATVIAPNILFPNTKTDAAEESFLAIEAVNTLIEYNEVMSEVPEDLQSILNDSTLFSGSADLTTKEILKRYGEITASTPSKMQPTQNNANGGSGSTLSSGPNSSSRPPASSQGQQSRTTRGGASSGVAQVNSASPSQSVSARQAEKSSVRPIAPSPSSQTQSANGVGGSFYANSMAAASNGSRDSFNVDRNVPGSQPPTSQNPSRYPGQPGGTGGPRPPPGPHSQNNYVPYNPEMHSSNGNSPGGGTGVT